MRNHVTTQVLNKVTALILTAGLRPEFKTEVQKQDNMTLPEIKKLAVRHENLIQEEKLKTKTSQIKSENPTPATHINEIDDEGFTTITK